MSAFASADPPIRIAEALRRVEGDLEILDELIQTFQQDLNERIEEIDAAVQHRDHDETRRTSHSLRGALAVFGAERGMALSKELEICGLEARADDAAHAWSVLREEIVRVTAFLSSPHWRTVA